MVHFKFKDSQGISEECAALRHIVHNYNRCYSVLYIFWNVIIYFSLDVVCVIRISQEIWKLLLFY